MTFRLTETDPQPEVRRIATELLDDALERLENAEGGSPEERDEAIHEARKGFKKVRAVLRLVRKSIGEGEYHKNNRLFRNLGRRLSGVRDAAVLVETVEGLRDHFTDQLYARAFEGVCKELVARHEAALARAEEEEDVTVVVETLRGVRERMNGLELHEDRWEALAGGLRRIYKRGYRDFARASDEPTDERLHDWRKRVKYLWHSLEVLHPLWPSVLEPLAESVHDLANVLGEDHDLAVLQTTLLQDPDAFGERGELEALFALLKGRREGLQASAQPLACRIYAETPDAFVERFGSYWHALERERALSPSSGTLRVVT